VRHHKRDWRGEEGDRACRRRKKEKGEKRTGSPYRPEPSVGGTKEETGRNGAATAAGGKSHWPPPAGIKREAAAVLTRLRDLKRGGKGSPGEKGGSAWRTKKRKKGRKLSNDRGRGLGRKVRKTATQLEGREKDFSKEKKKKNQPAESGRQSVA